MNEARSKDVLRSKEFDDVYFSAEDGLAETQHVFLAGNNLPAAWASKKEFMIAETGFGTGLNFLATWKLFEETAGADQALHFISIEKYPLSMAEIEAALSPWDDEFSEIFEIYKAAYTRAGGVKISFGSHVFLTLIIGDVNDVMGQVPSGVDCWFLDGFKPATNPDMWSDILFKNMAQLSNPGASFATFTAAGFVKRGLQAAGFNVQKIKGFGRKREMLVGDLS